MVLLKRCSYYAWYNTQEACKNPHKQEHIFWNNNKGTADLYVGFYKGMAKNQDTQG